MNTKKGSLISPRCRGYLQRVAAAGVVFLAVGLLPTPLFAQEAKLKPMLAKVETLFGEGRYAEALPLSEQCTKLALNLNMHEPGARGLLTESLMDSATLLVLNGKYSNAERFLSPSLEILGGLYGPDGPQLIPFLTILGQVYVAEGAPAKALPVYERAGAIAEKKLGPDDPTLALVLTAEAQLYAAMGRPAKAEPLLERAIAIAEKNPGRSDNGLDINLDSLGELRLQAGDLPEAEQLFTRALAIQEKQDRPNDPREAISLLGLGETYNGKSSPAKAIKFLNRALPIAQVGGTESPLVGEILDGLGQAFLLKGDFVKAKPLLTRGLAIAEKSAAPNSPLLVVALDNMANLYIADGNFAKALSLYRQALAIQARTFGLNSLEAAAIMRLQAAAYGSLNNYEKAQHIYERVLAIQTKLAGPSSLPVATSLMLLAGNYTQEGDNARAEDICRRALKIDEEQAGPQSPAVGGVLAFLSKVYVEEAKSAQAETTLQHALAIEEKALGPDSPIVVALQGNLGELDVLLGENAKAENILKRALAVDNKVFPTHTVTAAAMLNLAQAYLNEGKSGEAEPLLDKALAIFQEGTGPSNPDVPVALMEFAEFYDDEGRPVQAELQFQQSIAGTRRILARQFDFMSEKRRLQFLDTVSWTFPQFFSFVQRRGPKNPSLYGQMYDVVLWQKDMVAQGITSLRREIAASGDAQALSLFERLAEIRAQVSNLTNPDQPSRNFEYIQQLEQKANGIEAQLVQRSRVFARKEEQGQVTWRDVQRALKPGEAAVEYVEYPYNDGNKWTGDIEDVALVVTPKMKHPAFIRLAPLSEIASNNLRHVTAYAKWVSQKSKEGEAQVRKGKWGPILSFYDTFWKPLLPALRHAKTIYIAPGGVVLDQIAFSVIPTPGGKLLMDRYNLRIVNSTRDLLRKPQPPSGDTAVLIGDPKFQLSTRAQQGALASLHEEQPQELPHAVELAANFSSGMVDRGVQSRGDCPNMPPGGVLCPLPGTKKEIEDIASLLTRHHWTIEHPLDIGDRALEEAVLGVQHPRVLYLATHGFFFPDQQEKPDSPAGTLAVTSDPMLRSGLVFTGADQALLGFPPTKGMDDGVLTAYAASTLNLQGTELVVLSACDTGRGQYEDGEGIFGLRRAFQEAGAQAVLMSMWKVPDRETAELMTLFFRYWLGGMSKHAALKKAQLQMREIVERRYGADLPYYWGAWVLVGR